MGFNSRTPGGVRLKPSSSLSLPVVVSIHAPREGCDISSHGSFSLSCCFNSRTPGGVRQRLTRDSPQTAKFQFTHPGRGATIIEELPIASLNVSIHAPREGCDDFTASNYNNRYSFNSRTPGGVRLDDRLYIFALFKVSIHAPREGCDPQPRRVRHQRGRFNSRTPGGVRLR